MKDKVVYQNLRVAMQDIQMKRSDELGGHTWPGMVERYGECYLFMEIASIVSRLEQGIWVDGMNPYSPPPSRDRIDRLLDLCIDLGNFTDFLYQSLIKRIEAESSTDGEAS
jgi:hypothetical protein